VNNPAPHNGPRPWLGSGVMIAALTGSFVVHAAVVLVYRATPLPPPTPLPILSVTLTGVAAEPRQSRAAVDQPTAEKPESARPKPRRPHSTTPLPKPRPAAQAETLESAVAPVKLRPGERSDSQPHPENAVRKARSIQPTRQAPVDAPQTTSEAVTPRLVPPPPKPRGKTHSKTVAHSNPAATPTPGDSKPIKPEPTELAALTRQSGHQAARYAAPGLNNRPPRYPSKARRLGLEGRVVLRVVVDADGNATSVDVAHSSGHAILDRAARKAVKRWRFQPARQRGGATASTVDVPVSFRLENDA